MAESITTKARRIRARKNGKGNEVRLSMTQVVALRACFAEVQAARLRLGQVMRECGLDPAKDYVIQDDGLVLERKPEAVS
jgi:hypothetical protein